MLLRNLVAFLLIFAAGLWTPGYAFASEVEFQADVAPILAMKCFECHGPEAQESGFRLDRRESLLRGGDSGEPAVVPGNSKASHLISLITSGDSDRRMPPDGDPLSPQQIQAISTWIDSGAVMPEDMAGAPQRTTKHWSFQAVVRPGLPDVHGEFIATAIDRFVLGQLQKQGLQPSAAASPERLIRRLFLVMHGLPPTPVQLDRWQTRLTEDPVRGWAELVDAVLNDPRYGERWARHWLDIVRFGETHGFETNRERPNAWHYRDYVIQSLNDDLPYDQFVREQIVGDAIGAHVATGFLVAGPHDLVKSPDKNLTLMQRQDELADLINVTGTTFLGLTLGCARCHNHKFDPITQRDFYAIQAVFAGVNHGDRQLPLTAEQQTQLQQVENRIAELRNQLSEFIPVPPERVLLIDDEPDATEGMPGIEHLVDRKGLGTNPSGPDRGYADDQGGANRNANLSGGSYSWWSNEPGRNVAAWRPNVRGRFRVWISWGCGHASHTEDARYILDADGDLRTPEDQTQIAQVNQKLFADESGGAVGKALWSGFLNAGIHELQRNSRILLRGGTSGTAITADVMLLEQVDAGGASAGGTIPNLRPAVSATLNEDVFAPVDARCIRFTILETNSAEPCIDEIEVFAGGTNVALASTGTVATSSGNLTGYEIHKLKHINDGQFGNDHSWISNEPGKGWVQLNLPAVAVIDRVKWARDRNGRYADRLATRYRIEVSVDGEEWSEVSSSQSRLPFGRGRQSEPTYDFTRASAEKADIGKRWLAELQSLLPRKAELSQTTTVYAGNFRQPPPTHRLYRGDPLAPREEVGPDTIEVIGSLGLDSATPEKSRRRQFAQWLTSDENPLTARVIVNRIWQHHYGTGIVATPNDFGGNGVPPSHPKLLDWLAAELVDNEWSLKHIHRLILTSSVWRQDSAPRSDCLAVDAATRYLWRFPPRRLEAEAIRDSMVSVSGQLDLKMGGPGFSGFEVDMENVRHFFPKTSFGPEDFRRMIYMTKVRQERESVFGAFDCPDASQVISARSRSTTPLQALNLLNSPFAVQQSDLFAERLTAKQPAVSEQVRFAYRLCFGRYPLDTELQDALGFIAANGLPAFCRALLNANEFLFIP